MQTRAVLVATVREILRRRAALAALVALPLAFYLARHEMTGQSMRMLCLGLGWAIATLALFTTVSSADLDRRLRVVGYRWGPLVLGRLAAVTLVGSLLGRELEGALVLLTVLATQMIADPDGTLAKVLPFWSIRQLGTWTVDGVDASYLGSALTHAAVTTVVLWVLVAVTSGLRLRLQQAVAPGMVSSVD